MQELLNHERKRKEREIKILRALYANPAYAKELTTETGIPESTMHRILKGLKDMGIVKGEKTRNIASIVGTSGVRDYELNQSDGSVRVYGGPVPERCSLVDKYVEAVHKYFILK
jgi:predicted transcriptional regulator